MARTFDIAQLREMAAAERQRRLGAPQQVWEGTGESAVLRTLQAGDAGFVDYSDPNSAVDFALNNTSGRDGIFATFDPSTGTFRVAQGDATSGIQRFDVSDAGTVDLGFEDIDRKGKWNAGAATIAAMAALAAGGAYASGLMGTGAGGAASGAAAGGAAAGAGAGAAGTLLTPSNALLAGTLLSSAAGVQQGREQARAINDATAANERIATDQAAAAERTRLEAERARQAALAAGGSQGTRAPDIPGMRQRNRSGVGSTMLTGAGGVSSASLSLGAPTLLGRLG